MPETWFYILGPATYTDQVFISLAEKAWKKYSSLCIWADHRQSAQQLDELLWSWNPELFIPHSLLDQDYPPKNPPALLGWPGLMPPDCAVFINMSQHHCPESLRCTRLIELVPDEPVARTRKRQAWTLYRQRGWPVVSHELHNNPSPPPAGV